MLSNACVRSRQSRRSRYDTPPPSLALDTLVLPMVTNRSGSRNGSGRMAMVSTMLKMALLTPIPSARHRMVTAANPGLLMSVRAAYRRSCSSVCIRQ